MADGQRFWDLGLTTLYEKHAATATSAAYATMVLAPQTSPQETPPQETPLPLHGTPSSDDGAILLPDGLLVVEEGNRLFAGRFSYN